MKVKIHILMLDNYQWESTDDGNCKINFKTCEIYLVEGGAQ